MATAQEYKDAYHRLYEDDKTLSDATATALAASDSGAGYSTPEFQSWLSGQVESAETQYSTGGILGIWNLITGHVPSAADLEGQVTTILNEVTLAVARGSSASDAISISFKAMGASLANSPFDGSFATTWGQDTSTVLGERAFVQAAFEAVFNRAPTAGELDTNVASFDIVKAYYASAPVAETTTDARAKGEFIADLLKQAVDFSQGHTPLPIVANIDNALSDLGMNTYVGGDGHTLENQIGGSSNNPGGSFNLTIGVDQGAAFTGGSGDDVFNALPDANNGNANTLTAFDSLHGNAGNDTLNIVSVSTGTFNAIPGTATIDGIETINVTSTTTSAVNVAADNATGLQTVNVNDLAVSTGTVTVTTNANATSVNVAAAGNSGGNGHTVNVTDNGATDTLATVTLDGYGFNTMVSSDALANLTMANSNHRVGVTDNTAGHELHVTVDNLAAGARVTDNVAATLDVTAKSASTIDLFGASVSTLNIDGAAGLTITQGGLGSLTSIVSFNTAGVTVTDDLGNGVSFTGGDGADTITVDATNGAIDMGAGNDTVNVNSALGTGTLNGGDGTDTVVMTADLAASLTSDFGAAVTNFEKLSIDAVGAGVIDNINLADIGINYVISAGTTNGSGSPETDTVTFQPLLNGQSVTVGTETVTATGGDLTAQQVADAFVNGTNGAAVQSGSANAGYTVTNPTSGQVVLTATSNGDKSDLGLTTQAPAAPTAPTAVTTQGTDTVPATTETASVQFVAIAATGHSVTVGGLTYTAGQALTAQQVAAVFQGLSDGATTSSNGILLGGTFTGALSGWSSGQANGSDTETFTASTPGNVTDISVASSNAETPVVTETQGTNTVAATTETAVVTFHNMLEGQSETVAGLTVTAPVGGFTAAQAADAYFAHIDTSGTLTGWTVANATAGDASLEFTSTTPGNVTDISTSSDTSTVATPTSAIVDGSSIGGGGELNLTHVANGSTLELTGDINGASSVTLTDASGTADVFNLKLDSGADINAPLTTTGIETVAITTGGSAAHLVQLDDATATTVTVSGSAGVDFSGSTLGSVTMLDASGVSAASGAAGAVTFVTSGAQSVTINTGNGNDYIDAQTVTSGHSATISTGDGNDIVFGGQGNDTINLGAGADLVSSSAGVDTITLGSGNDVYSLVTVTDSNIAHTDTITDFQANTVGASTGALGAQSGTWNGDVIDLRAFGYITAHGVSVLDVNNAADAQTFLQNTAAGSATTGIALDSSTGNVYIDVDHNGTADSVIHLAGVSSITAAAFEVG